jgi:hypothetical protein
MPIPVSTELEVGGDIPWTNVSMGDINWSSGEHVLMVQFLTTGEIAFRDMIIDVLPYQGTPFNGPHTVPCVVEAEDYDNGGESVAYHETASGVVNNEHRQGENVRLEIRTYGDVINVGDIQTGEWLKYTVEVPEAGNYAFDFTFSAWNETAITVSIDDEAIGTYPVPNTGEYGVFQGSEYFTTALQAGIHVIKIDLGRYTNFDKFEIRKSTAIKKIETPAGKVYAENGKLHVEGYSASASVEVYNLVGQKVAAAKSLNGKTVDVSKGLFIVKVTDKGKSVSYKVVVK